MKTLLCVLMVLVSVLAVSPALARDHPGPEATAAYTAHAPIQIWSDAALTAPNGVTGGSGTPSDPYVIAGWEITSYTGHLIEIANTRASLVIRDVYVHGGRAGIFLFNVSNLQVDRAVSSANGDAVRMEAVSNVSVNDSNLTDCAFFGLSSFMTGVYVSLSHDVTVAGNRFWGNCVGVDLESSTNVTVQGNAFTGDGVVLWGTAPEHFLSHTFSGDNLVNGKPLLVYRDTGGLTLDRTVAGEILLLNVTGARLSNLTIEQTDVGVLAASVQDLRITDSRFADDPTWGLAVFLSERVLLARNVIENTYEGIALVSVHDTAVEDNTLGGSATALFIRTADNLTVRGNDMVGNGFGGADVASAQHSAFLGNRLTNVTYAFRLSGSSNNTVAGNVIASHSGYALSLISSRDNVVIDNDLSYGVALGLSGVGTTNNTIYHNSLRAAAGSVSFSGAGPNTWDDGYPMGGNFWSWYTGADACRGPAQDDCSGGDGIGDTPVVVAAGNEDHYPLMTAWDVPPSALFTVTPSTGTAGSTFDVDASASFDPQNPSAVLEVRWDWESDGFWDTNWSTTRTAEHIYTTPGAYDLRLQVRDPSGFLNATAQTIHVASPITATIVATPPSGAAPLSVSFQLTVDGAVAPLAYLWQFGDGATSAFASPSHTYSAPGNYSVIVGITDAREFTGSAHLEISVGEAPLFASAAASVARGVAPLSVSFTSTVDGGRAPYSLGWVFGDGQTSGQANPVHTYAEAGHYLVQLVVRDAHGTLLTVKLTIDVVAALDANPSAVDSGPEAPAEVTFTGNATGGTGPYVYVWEFGDGSGSTAASPSHTYTQAGEYTVTLTVTDAEGRSVIRTFQVVVSSPKAAGAPGGDLTWILLVGVAGAAAAVLVAALWWRRSLR